MVNQTQSQNLSFLKSEFLRDAKVLDHEKGYISVSSFTVRMNPAILDVASDLVVDAFSDQDITSVHGIPHSGNYLATAVALKLGDKVRLHSSRKDQNIPATWKDIYRREVKSFTASLGGIDVFAGLTFSFVRKGDKILILDDVCAYGETGYRIVSGLQEKGVEVVGFGVLLDKVWQGGLERVASLGVKTFSCIRIKSIDRNDLFKLL